MINMSTKQTAVLASIALATLVGVILFLNSQNAALGISDVTRSAPSSRGSGITDIGENPSEDYGTAQKIIVEVEDPYGKEILTSYRVVQTDNLVAKGNYHLLRLMAPITKDKTSVLPWIADSIGKEPLGVAADGVGWITGDIEKMSKDPNNANVQNNVASLGKVNLILSLGETDVTETDKVREIKYSGCYVADYNFTPKDHEGKSWGFNGYQNTEQITFACSKIDDISGSGDSGILYQRAQLHPQIMNQNGEIILKSKEKYGGQPTIAIEDQNQSKLETKSKQVVPKEIVTRTELDKASYKTGDKAKFTVTFTDLEGNNIDPDTIKAYYDSQVVKLQKQDVGVYTFTTSGLAKANHQLIINVEKSGFPTSTSYLSLPIQRIS